MIMQAIAHVAPYIWFHVPFFPFKYIHIFTHIFNVPTTISLFLGLTVFNGENGLLNVVQQFRVADAQNIKDLPGLVGANAIVISPDDRFVFVTSGGYYSDHNLLSFARDEKTGTLTLLENIDIYNISQSKVLPSALVMSPDGKNLYVVGENFAISTSAILSFSIESQTGKLTQIQELGALRSTLLTSAQFEPTGNFLYCTSTLGTNLVWVFRRESFGGLTAVANHVAHAEDAHVQPPTGSYTAAVSLLVTPESGLLFTAIEKEGLIYYAKIQPENGRIAYYPNPIGSPGTAFQVKRPVAMAYNAEQRFFYVSGDVENTISTFRITV